MASPTKSKRRLSRGRRSLACPVLLDGENELCKDIPLTSQPSERLERLVRESALFAVQASLPPIVDPEIFTEVKEDVENVMKRMKKDGLFHECTKRVNITGVESPTENTNAVNANAVNAIKRLEKEKDRWELLLKKYKAMDEANVKEMKSANCEQLSENFTVDHGRNYYADQSVTFDTKVERMRMQLKVIKQSTSEMLSTKKKTESLVDSLAAKLHAETQDCPDHKQVVSSLLQNSKFQ